MKIKIASLSLLTILSVKGFSATKDLNDLKERWESIEMTESRDTFIPQPVLDEHPSGFSPEIALKNSSSDLHSLNSANFQSLSIKLYNKDVRSNMLKELFTKTPNHPRFCMAFPTIKYEPKEGEKLTQDELSKKERRLNLNNCKKQISTMLTGSFYMNPTVWIMKVFNSNSSGILELYVQSVIDEKQYLRYQFTL